MNTAFLWKGKAKGCSLFLVFLFLWIMVPASWAAYEVNTGDITANVLTNTPTQWTEDLKVEWEAPTMAGTDILNGYFYKWNESVTSLNASDVLFTDFSVTDYGTVDPQLDPPSVTKDGADLADLDSGNFLYLHIMTFYTAGTGARASADVVYGPFMIDNVAPVGAVRIVDGAGNDITSTTDTNLNLLLSAAKDPASMYLSETSAKPATGVAYSTEAVWSLIDTTPGTKTIYAWFEDTVGNISSAPVTDSVELLPAISISPYTATLDLVGTATQIFRAEGTSATYNWSIINEKNEAGTAATAGTIAEFSGTSSAVNSVTVKGLAKGSFQLQAVPTSGTGTLTSGTLTVVQTSTTRTYNLVAGLNIISLSRTGTGWTKAADMATAVGANCQSIIKWDAANQGFVAHIKGTPLNNFDLVDGDGYFINVNGGVAFSITGQTVTRTYSLLNGLNLVGMLESKSALKKAADLAADVGSACLSIIKWDASNQGFVAHITGTPLNNYDIAVGEGYFINVNANTQW